MTISKYILAACCLFCGLSNAQQFNYTLSQTSSQYAIINGDSIAGDLNSDVAYTLPIGFPFNFLGAEFESVKVSPRGYFSFDTQNNYCISVFENLFTLVDSAHNSAITYITSGTAGNRICKIQFSDFTFGMSAPGEYINFQLWLYEQNNKIEIHAGPVNADLAPNPLKPLVGLVNKQQNTSPWALVLSGNASSAETVVLSGTSENSYMNDLPTGGTVYVFSVN